MSTKKDWMDFSLSEPVWWWLVGQNIIYIYI